MSYYLFCLTNVSELPIFSAKKIMLLEVDDSYLSVDGSLKDRSRRLSTAYCNGSESFVHAVDGSSTIVFARNFDPYEHLYCAVVPKSW
jgi:hypothetical protein